MKICKNCNTEKPYTDYFKAKSNSDGYMCVCKECQYKRVHNNMKLEDYIGKNYKDIIKQTKIILTNLGYDINNPNNPVYRQFNRRFLIWKYNRGY